MFCVYDNNKPASGEGFLQLAGKGWTKYRFHSFEAAHAYAIHWLGQCGEGVQLKVNTPYDYSGYGDIIEIRQEN